MSKIVMFGSFVVDLMGRAGKLPGPGETIFAHGFQTGPGGKGSNQGVAVHRAGGDLRMITKVGEDMFGQVARDFYAAEGIDDEFLLVDEEVATGAALIMVDETTAQNAIYIMNGASGHITSEDLERVKPEIKKAEYLLMQLELNLDATCEIIKYAHDEGVKVVVNTAPYLPIDEKIFQYIDIVTPNEIEAECFTGVKVEDEASALQAAGIFREKGVKDVVITLGSRGVFVLCGQEYRMIPAKKVRAVDTTGAGDAFNGGFVTALSEGKDMFSAVEFGNQTAALSVMKKGSSVAMPLRKDIDAAMLKERTEEHDEKRQI